ncbi:MAG: VOC family protein [Actinomycetota bacterium]|nr:VOC family protein [Actinomycetota bacterium]
MADDERPDDGPDAVANLRPDRVQPDDSVDPARLAGVKGAFLAGIGQADDGPALRTPDVYPRLAYRDQLAAVTYMTDVFGFTELREARRDHGDHHLCWVRIGNGIVMIGPPSDVHRIESPLDTGGASAMMMVYVHDVDAHHARARARGADVTMDLADAFYGERRYEATDPEGHRWHFAERFADIEARTGHPVTADDPDHDEPGV